MQVKNCTFVSFRAYANQLPNTPFDTALPAVEPTQDVFTVFSQIADASSDAPGQLVEPTTVFSP